MQSENSEPARIRVNSKVGTLRLAKAMAANKGESNLAREEWDFQDCPTPELEYCCRWELLRESSLAQELFEKIKKALTVNPKFFIEDWVKTLPDNLLSLACFESNFLKGFSNWYPKPWLTIPAKERLKLLAEAHGEEWARKKPNINWAVAEVSLNDDFKLGPDQYCLSVNFDYSDAQIIKSFEGWLSKKRNLKRKAVEQRGKIGWRELLNQLGAYRLLKRMTWKKAAEYSAKFQKEGKSLYSEQTAWMRAQVQASIVIKNFEQKGYVNLPLQVEIPVRGKLSVCPKK